MMKLSYPATVTLGMARILVRAALAIAVGVPALLALEVFYRCVMCGVRCGSALQAADHRSAGERVPLCTACFEHEGRLLHAMAFARATWRR